MAFPLKPFIPMVVRGDPRATAILERVPDSPTFSFDLRRGSVNTQYWLKWDGTNTNIPEAVKDFLGYSKETLFSEKIGGKWYIKRHIPFEHPSFPDYLFCDSIQTIKGDVPARYGNTRDVNDVVEYDLALVNPIFASRPYRILTDGQLKNATGGTFPDESKWLRYITMTFTPTTKVQKIPSGNAFKWTSTPRDTNNQPVPASNIGNVVLTEADVVITHYQVPVTMIPWEAILETSRGRTNSDTVGSLLPGSPGQFDPSHLLYLGAKMTEPYPMPSGEWAVDIAHQMRYFPFGPNSFLRWDATRMVEANGVLTEVTRPAFQLVTRTGNPVSGQRLYPSIPYNRLFWGPDQIHNP